MAKQTTREALPYLSRGRAEGRVCVVRARRNAGGDASCVASQHRRQEHEGHCREGGTLYQGVNMKRFKWCSEFGKMVKHNS